jgi:hypothetical protein
MPIEMLTYAELGERLNISPEAARALVKRHRLPRSRSNAGKTLVQVDLSEINRADFEREYGRSNTLLAELLKASATIAAAQSKAAHLEGKLSILTQPWWRRLLEVFSSAQLQPAARGGRIDSPR